MTVMDDRTIQELGATSFTQIGDFSPNVMMHEAPGKVGGAISIRGFKNAETISTFEPKVALYLDGVLIAKNAGSAFDVLDLERIEILRGPQGTLYGRNATGGAVLMEGMCEAAEEILGMPVRLGFPVGVKGIVQLVQGPQYAAGVGLVRYGAQKLEELDTMEAIPGYLDASVARMNGERRGFWGWLREAF